MAEKTKKKGKKLTMTITTPRGVKFVEDADMLVMVASDGNMGVMPGHEPLSVTLGDGILRVINNGSEKKLAVFGGMAEIDQDSVNIFTTIAQMPEEIDRERAERDLREAEEALSEKMDDAQLGRLQMLLRRSLVRLEVNLQMEEEGYFDEED